ncbi:MAG: helix-turn-helix domain-containing protein [Candidatus Dormibacteraeota bacterium]|nr:helix-turn-helix domain-containing protein [Candidatus Dormibacteraeota bacterium]
MVLSVERSFRVLDLLGRSPVPLGTSEVARRLRLAKSTTHGLLRALEAVEAVEKVRLGYRLGPAVERLASLAELRRRWRPVLERLAREVGETAFLAQPRGSRVVILDEVLGSGAPVVSAPVGSFVPASAAAIRKVLAGAPLAEDRGEYLQGVNAMAAAVPGGVVFVAGFADRLDCDRLSEVRALLEGLLAEGEAGRTAPRR